MAETSKNKGGTTKNSPNPNGDVREKNGHFAKGNQLRKGKTNPTAAKVQQLKQAMLKAVTEGDIKAIINKLKQKAKKGDTCAANIILDRCLGKPVQSHEISGKDGEPLPPIQVILKQNE